MSFPIPDWPRRALAEIGARLEPATRAQREALLDCLGEAGLPGRGDERWRYTDPEAILGREWRAAGLPDAPPDLERMLRPAATRCVFVNGRYAAHLSSHEALAGLTPAPTLPEANAERPVAMLAGALATGGIDWTVEADQGASEPLHLLFWRDADADAFSATALRLHLRAGARATVLLDHAGAGGLHLQSLDLRLEQGAELRLQRLQRERQGATLLLDIHASVGPGARLDVAGVDAGGGLSRTDLRVDLDGQGAHTAIATATGITGNAHADQHVLVTHCQPGATSRQLFRGVADGKARIVLDSRVLVQPGAAGTDSEQSLRHMLLARGCEVDAKPELEIHADDVRCQHGATVGALDLEQLHYLRTRGIAADEARALLIGAFLGEALAALSDGAVRRLADDALRAMLPTLPDMRDWT